MAENIRPIFITERNSILKKNPNEKIRITPVTSLRSDLILDCKLKIELINAPIRNGPAGPKFWTDSRMKLYAYVPPDE